MVFSSVTFLLVFLPLFLVCYYLVPNRGRNTVLFLFSLLFYSWGEPVYVVLMLFSTMLDYTCGLQVDRHRGTPVSYTHLDVYKRQVLMPPGQNLNQRRN